ncbi:MAG TPA: FtsX-like permease family protein, partial [Bacteroidota bacterium]|nr:FtsX-like permease family protein [Bacteroidota bacterium]
SHAPISIPLQSAIDQGKACAVLLAPAAIFPAGRVQSAVLRGVDPNQKILKIPSSTLLAHPAEGRIPALVGSQMAKNAGLHAGDVVTVRWRDVHGTYDATDVEIVEIMSTFVHSIDAGQIWVPLDSLRRMLQAPGQATMVTLAKDVREAIPGSAEWVFRDHGYLLKDLNDFIARKRAGSKLMYTVLLGMALLAVFDTQVLSIFRRRKEMGTMMALGMTRGEVIGLFTLEGSLHGLLALILGSIYGIPILAYLAWRGIGLPEMSKQIFSLGATLYPRYGISLYMVTSAVLLVSVVIVSFLPTRRIARLKVTDALRGRTQ